MVDRIHLVYDWGPEFCIVYETLFTMRARLPEWTGFTATLEPGPETDAIIRSISFKANFHFEKRDCERHSVDEIYNMQCEYPAARSDRISEAFVVSLHVYSVYSELSKRSILFV